MANQRLQQIGEKTAPATAGLVPYADAAYSEKTITGATQANPVVITATSHGFNNGDVVWITNVGGMTEINDQQFTVANVTANTFELSGEDGSSHTAYTSGGAAIAGRAQRMTLANLFKVINSLSTLGSPDTAADYVPVYDADAGEVKKALWPSGGGGAESPLTLEANGAAELPLTVKGAAAQTADLFSCTDSTDVKLFAVEADGKIKINDQGEIFDNGTGIEIYNPTGEFRINTVGSPGDIVLEVLGKTTIMLDASTKCWEPKSDGGASLGASAQRWSQLFLSSYLNVAVLNDGTRGAAGTQGRVIFNTDDLNLNIDNGTNWILPDGTPT